MCPACADRWGAKIQPYQNIQLAKSGAHKAIGESSQSEKKEIKVTKEGLYEAVDGHS